VWPTYVVRHGSGDGSGPAQGRAEVAGRHEQVAKRQRWWWWRGRRGGDSARIMPAVMTPHSPNSVSTCRCVAQFHSAQIQMAQVRCRGSCGRVADRTSRFGRRLTGCRESDQDQSGEQCARLENTGADTPLAQGSDSPHHRRGKVVVTPAARTSAAAIRSGYPRNIRRH
jgi:hypothetical protein